MNLTKRLPLALSIASAIALACLTVYQSGLISDIKNELTWTITKLTKTTEALQAEMVKNEQLEQELAVYKDSVNLLNRVIEDLNAKITGLKNNVRQLNGQLKKKEDKVVALTTEIGRLRNKSRIDEQRIKELEKTRDDMLLEMEKLDHERMAAANEAKKLKNQLGNNEQSKTRVEDNIARISKTIAAHPAPKTELRVPPAQTGIEYDKITQRPQKKLTSIVTNTKVNFHNIVLRNKEHGKDLSKVKSGWKYT
ncbi:MAG: hypothetical protein ACE5FF_06420, partial [Saprospiraceae bacterium]